MAGLKLTKQGSYPFQVPSLNTLYTILDMTFSNLSPDTAGTTQINISVPDGATYVTSSMTVKDGSNVDVTNFTATQASPGEVVKLVFASGSSLAINTAYTLAFQVTV